jgi:uncharacterized protein (UPF0262 family)
MSDRRLIAIELDDHSVFWRSADAAQERRVAAHDLLENNFFKPLRDHKDGYAGPYRLLLSVSEGRLVLTINHADDTLHEVLILGMARFRRPVRDYHAICDSYYQAVRQVSPQMIETIDMARRGVHNDAAELLIEKLAGKVEIDFDTARRLFTLIAVLHIKG